MFKKRINYYDQNGIHKGYAERDMTPEEVEAGFNGLAMLMRSEFFQTLGGIFGVVLIVSFVVFLVGWNELVYKLILYLCATVGVITGIAITNVSKKKTFPWIAMFVQIMVVFIFADVLSKLINYFDEEFLHIFGLINYDSPIIISSYLLVGPIFGAIFLKGIIHLKINKFVIGLLFFGIVLLGIIIRQIYIPLFDFYPSSTKLNPYIYIGLINIFEYFILGLLLGLIDPR